MPPITLDAQAAARIAQLERDLEAERAKCERLCAALAAAQAVTGRALTMCH